MYMNRIFLTVAQVTGLDTANTLAELTHKRELAMNSQRKPTPKVTHLSGCSYEILGI